MTRWIVAWALVSVCGPLLGDARGQPDPQKDDPHAAAFAQLRGSDPLGVYRGFEYLSQAGKTDATIPPRLARMMWDRDVNETSRYWALRTLAEIGPPAKAVMPDLVKAMESADPYYRLRGSIAILRAGGPAEKPLATLKALARGNDPFVRMETLMGLGALGPLAKDALPFLTELASEKGNRHRDLAVDAIGSMGPAAKGSVPLLAKLLDEEDKDVRDAAARALGRLAPDVPEALKPLLKVVGEKGWGGYSAAEALARGGKSVVPVLIELLQGDNDIARGNAAHALRFMGRTAASAAEALAKAVPKLTEELARDNAIRALGNLGPAGVPHLLGLLKNPEVRKYKVCEAIGEIGPEARAAVPALLAVLKNPESDQLDRAKAGDALVRIGPGAVAALPDLIALIPDEDHIETGARAIEVIGAIGPEAKDAVKPLLEAIRTDKRGDRYGWRATAAAKALGRIGKPAEPAIPVLIEMLSSDSARVAAEALGRFGPAAKEALKPLRELYAKDDGFLRIDAALAVSRIDPEAKDGIEVLIRGLNPLRSKFPEFERQDAVKALGMIGPRAKDALEPLRKLLDNNTELSARAALAIYRINPGDTAALDSLVRTLASKESFGPGVACDALAAIGPAAKAAIPELRRVAQFHSGYYERDHARLAIRAIDPSQEP
jgi:HEAT repeat protein